MKLLGRGSLRGRTQPCKLRSTDLWPSSYPERCRFERDSHHGRWRDSGRRGSLRLPRDASGRSTNFASCRTGSQHPRQVRLAKNVSEKAFRIAGHPAITLGDRSLGIHRDELIGTIFLPDARKARRAAGEMVNQRVEWPERHSGVVSALHPDIEEAREKAGQLLCIELKRALDFRCRTSRKWGIHLEVARDRVPR